MKWIRLMPWLRAFLIAAVILFFFQHAGILSKPQGATARSNGENVIPRLHGPPPPPHGGSMGSDVVDVKPIDPDHEKPDVHKDEVVDKMAVAIVLTEEAKTEAKRHLLADGAAVLAESVHMMNSKWPFDLVAIVHPTVKHSIPILEKLGWRVLVKEDPVELDPKKGTAFFRETVQKAGCCGLREMLKMHAFRLHEYKKVLLLDIDTLIVQNIDELFEKDIIVQYTEDLPMDPGHHNAVPPMQGGFFLVQPGPETDKIYDDIQAIMVDGNFNAGTGWNNSHIGYHWGGAAVQGVYAYYFAKHAPKEWAQPVDRCIYNYMGPDDPKLMKAEELNKCTIDEIKTTHFTICQKPWSCHIKNEGACKGLHQKWWDVRFRVEENLFPDRVVEKKPCTNQPFPYKPIGISV